MGRRLLVVDENPSTIALLEAELAKRGYALVAERSPDAALKRLATDDPGAVMCDVALTGGDGLALCRTVAELPAEIPVIVTATDPTVATAVAAIRAGACDFLTKPVAPVEWLPTIDRAFERSELRRNAKRMQGLISLDCREGKFLPMEVIERRYVRTVLDALGGNKASTARMLRVDRRTLYRKLDRWNTCAAWEGDDVAAAE